MASLKIAAKLENLNKMITFIKFGANSVGFSKKQIYYITLASEEILTNIIKYAFPEKEGDVKIKYKRTKEKEGLEIIFIDSGIQFDPLSIDPPDITIPAENRNIGGLGIHLVYKTMDKVKYKWKNKKNILSITLYKDKSGIISTKDTGNGSGGKIF